MAAPGECESCAGDAAEGSRLCSDCQSRLSGGQGICFGCGDKSTTASVNVPLCDNCYNNPPDHVISAAEVSMEQPLPPSIMDKARDPRRQVGGTSPMMMGGVEGLGNEELDAFLGERGSCAYGACGNARDPKSMLSLCPECHDANFGSKYMRGDR